VDDGGSTQTIMTQFTLPPEVAAANEILLTMKTALGSLGVRSSLSNSKQYRLVPPVDDVRLDAGANYTDGCVR
jgi:hypothetical protein